MTIENAALRHRHGKAWGYTLQDEGAMGPLFTPRQVWVGWVWIVSVAIVGAVIWGVVK